VIDVEISDYDMTGGRHANTCIYAYD